MEIKIKDVKDFLEHYGYNWNEVLRLNNSRTMFFVKKLQCLKELIMLVDAPIKISKGEESLDRELSVEVRLCDFVVNTKSTDRSFVFNKSLKDEWMSFLERRYGKEYKREVNMIKHLSHQNSNYGFGRPMEGGMSL